ncbi:MAG: N-carbamoylputrescine amidase [Acidobacteriota bacterium]|nr:N-carbamoylputrescine amidase [Acidobacteriota bacterium]
MRELTVAALQMACGPSRPENLERMERLVREAAGAGARVVVPQELFADRYFCKDERPRDFDLAEELSASVVVRRFAALARELGVVIPISFFERAGQSYFNSVAVADADGSLLGLYRKSHIPDGPGYEEKYYFSPGDTGFAAFATAAGTIGVGICWDQWFPECARALALLGAEVLCYPTAIGSEPRDPGYDTSPHWRRVMQGHAAANMVPVVASNRVGEEVGDPTVLTFYGTSFIADGTGAVVAELDRVSESFVTATFDRDELVEARAGFGLFRDRRPDLYGALVTRDGLLHQPS